MIICMNKFDSSTAKLRDSGPEEKALLSALATRMRQSIPGVRVAYSFSFLKKNRHVRCIEVTLGGAVYILRNDRNFDVECAIAHLVRGVTIQSEVLPFNEWLKALSEAAAKELRDADSLRSALNEFLIGD